MHLFKRAAGISPSERHFGGSPRGGPARFPCRKPSRQNGRLEVPLERLLTIQEAAEKPGIKPNTLYLWTSKRKIAHRKIGRLVRFRECDLEEFVEQQRQSVRGGEQE